MSVLVLGAEGMLGSVLVQRSSKFFGTTRRDRSNSERVLPGIDITRPDDLRRAIAWARPEAIVNCAGIVKSECDRHSPDRVSAVNGTAPHIVAQMAPGTCRVVHVSTDCVFDGTRGGRTEEDPPDAIDLYGQTKASGELLDYAHCVTLRTSFIGRDHVQKRGLLEWLLAQQDEAVGYTNAWWSGLSTHELARTIEMVLSDPSISGLHQVVGPIISKADLLETLIEAYRLPCRVRRVSEPSVDRSMDGSKFRRTTGYVAPQWSEMAKELATT